jgi:hypothetical protein
MPPAITGIAHGYALWTTGQIENPFGCVYGSKSPDAIQVLGAGITSGPDECMVQDKAIGMLVFLHEVITQEKACEAARALRKLAPSLVVFGGVYGLEVKQLDNGLDYASPRIVWCSTPIESGQLDPQSDYESPRPDTPPARIT